jgi:hypothetical protein
VGSQVIEPMKLRSRVVPPLEWFDQFDGAASGAFSTPVRVRVYQFRSSSWRTSAVSKGSNFAFANRLLLEGS